jgi:flagella basal body P-ring formation protein FlgA
MCNYIYRLIKKLCIITMFSSVGVLYVNASEMVRLTFHDSVTVDDTVIYLKNIAAISADPERATELSNVIVGESAPPGFSRFISPSELINYRLSNYNKNIVFKSDKSDRVIVRTACVEKKVSEYKELIYSYLRNTVSWANEDWEYTLENDRQTFKCFNAPIAIEIRGLTEKYPRGAVRLEFIARQYNKSIKIPLSCHFKIITGVVTAKSDIPRNKIITLSDCAMKKQDISSRGPDPLFLLSDVVGKKAARTITAGNILSDQMIIQNPDIMKGDNISLEISKGNVKISVSAIARENGCVGKKIWVENASTNKLVRVLVKDKNSATLL